MDQESIATVTDESRSSKSSSGFGTYIPREELNIMHNEELNIMHNEDDDDGT